MKMRRTGNLLVCAILTVVGVAPWIGERARAAHPWETSSTATQPSGTATSAASTDRQKFDAYIESARAFAEAHEKAKAIEEYEKAGLVAPDEEARTTAREELHRVNSWLDSEWLSPSLKQLQVVWLWLSLIVGLLFLLGVLRRLHRWIQDWIGGGRQHIVIGPASSEFAAYFCDLVRMAHHAFTQQIELTRQINRIGARSVAPTFVSGSLFADQTFSLPAEVADKWWSPFATRIVKLIDPPQYTVDLGVLRLDKRYGMSVRLCRKGRVLQHWHNSCADDQVPETTSDLAYKVVACIMNQAARK